MVPVSFLIINDVIITSILLFKIINVLNLLTRILSNKFLFQRNAFRFIAILGRDMGSAIKQHGVIMMSHFVIVSINFTQMLAMVDNYSV